jgi:TPR repeat protein
MAFALYEEAATRGSGYGAYAAGQALCQGRGVTRDRRGSFIWLHQADRLGYKAATRSSCYRDGIPDASAGH